MFYKTHQAKSVDDRILQAIAGNPGMSIGLIASNTKIRYETVINAIPRLLDENRIDCRNRGYYLRD